MTRRLFVWVILPLLLIAGITAITYGQPEVARPLLTEPSSWRASGGFLATSSVDRLYIFGTDTAALYWQVPYFNRTPSGDSTIIGDGAGKLTSEPFLAADYLRFMVRGDLSRPENLLFFRREDTGKLLRFSYRGDGFFWRQVTFAFPSDWIGKRVRLMAEAGPRTSEDFLGVTNPVAVSYGRIHRPAVQSLLWLPLLVFTLFLFLLPGLPVAARLARMGLVEPSWILPAAIILSCVAGYVTFWAYFLSSSIGLAVGASILAAGAVALAIELRYARTHGSPLFSSDLLLPLALMALTGLAYLALLFSVNTGIPYELDLRTHFLEFVLAYDNELPYFFAKSLYLSTDPRAIAPGWQSSDRPPLQAGLVLLQLPFAFRLPNPAGYAMIAGTAMQSSWVAAVWSLWSAAGLSRRRAGLAFLFVVLSGFALINTIFTWPKLLSAALVLFAVNLAFFRGNRSESYWPLGRALAFGLTTALASLSHAGVAFTLLPLGLFLLLPRYYPGLTRLLIAAGVYGVTLCPWLLYQNLYDPPGNKLLRQHLAGDTPAWSDERSLSRNLWDAYRNAGFAEVVHNKLENLRMLFMASKTQYPWPPLASPADWPVDAIGVRRCDFMCLFWAPGLLNVGWLVAACSIWKRAGTLDSNLGVTVPALGLAAVVVWVLLMFGPGGTVIHQGSYATVLLLFAGLAAWLATLPERLTVLILIGQGLLFAFAWIWTCPALESGMSNYVAIPVAFWSFAALVRLALGEPAPKKVPAKKPA